jgi:hypothetical protein
VNACAHENFASVVNVGRITEVEGGSVVRYTAEVTINCADCNEKFDFVGIDAGSSPHRPMMSWDATEARLPLKPHFGGESQ